MPPLLDDPSVVQRIFDHIDRGTTDTSEEIWREPVAHYRSPERLDQERALLRRHPTPFCPSAALPEVGSYIARDAAGTPLLAVRGRDGVVRVFRNACRHRGTQLALGSDCARAFVCPYHGWTYALDGGLQHVPHEHGFPGLEKERLGLVPVSAVEQSGLVIVTQDGPHAGDAALDDLVGPLIPPHAKLIESNEQETAANWKILVDSFLEGYHTRFTHRDTFYPVQYDNLTLVETFGNHHRITFPFRTIEKLRHVPPAERRIDGRVLTHVYHLFPNVSVVTLPEHVRVLVYEPLAVDRTRVFGYTLSVASQRYEGKGTEEFERAREFAEAGGREDTAVSLAIQSGLASGANDSFVFGRFEGAVAHFHRTLQALIEAAYRP